jgi:RNA polymerase sigma factor (sigma-70 family)
MNPDELSLWARYREGDQSSREELILFYLPLAIVWARRVSKIAGWANWEDLKQDGVVGLIKAIERFDPGRGVEFRYFARSYIRGAIFDSPELTRDLARRQEEVYRKVRRTEDELTKALQRNPTIEEVAEKSELTVEQICNAIDAVAVAFAEELPDAESAPPSPRGLTPQQDKAFMLLTAISYLSSREEKIIRLYYWEDKSHKEIAEIMGLSDSNVLKIRQRAILKLGKVLDVERRAR